MFCRPCVSSCCCFSASICCKVKKGLRRLLTGSSGWDTAQSSNASGWRHCTWRRKFFLCLVVKWHISQEKGFSPVGHTFMTQRFSSVLHSWGEHKITNKLLCESLSATLTCVFDGQMGDEELLFRSGVFTVVTLEGPVVSVGQLMVEQQLLVVASVIAKFTLEPSTSTSY